MPVTVFAYPKKKVTLIICSLAIGGFGIGIGEFAFMGLMPVVALDLGVSEPQVGHLISVYALGVVVGAPLFALLGARVFRQRLLVILMGFYSLGNFAIAMAANYETLLVYRFISGLPHGAYLGIAALVSASLVPTDKRAKAVSLTMTGLTLALLLGNPLATLLGQHFDWRYVFGFIAIIAGLTAVSIFVTLPLNREESHHSPLSELRAFNHRAVWYPMAIGAIGFAGMFTVLSYLAPTLLNVTQAEPLWIPIALFLFGVGGFVGNILGGWLFDRLRFQSVGWILLSAVAVLMLFPVAAGSIWSMLVICFLVALMVAMAPALQTHLMDVAVGAQTLAATSHQAAFNLANALGPWFGGMAINAGMGWQSTGYVGAVTASVGLIAFFIAWKNQNQTAEVTTAC